MRDHDELGAVGVAPQELDEAADVGVVERGLDLVEEVERARLREEEREQERDRSERLLAAGEHPEARDLLPRRPELDLDHPRLSPPSSSGSTSRSRPSPPGKSVAATSSKCSATAWNVSANRRSTVSASSSRRSASSCRLCSRSCRCTSSSASRSFSASYSSFASGLTWPSWIAALLEPLGARRELVALVSLGGIGGGLFEPAASVGRLRLDPGQLDLDLRRPLRGLLGALAQLDLGRAELAQRCSQLARAGGARVDAGAERRLEALRGRDGRSERLVEPLGAGEHAPEQVGVERPGARARARMRRGSPSVPTPPPRPLRGRAARPPRSARAPPARPGRARLVDLQQPDLPFAAETARSSSAAAACSLRARGLSARLVLEPADARELARELGRPLGAGDARPGRTRPRRRRRARRLRPASDSACCALACSAATSPSSSRRRVSSSSRTASAASPANQSSPRCGS